MLLHILKTRYAQLDGLRLVREYARLGVLLPMVKVMARNPLEPPVVQECVCGGAEAGGGAAAREVQAGDEGDCGASPQCGTCKRAQAEQEDLVLLAARAGGGTGGGEGVLQLAGPASGGCGSSPQ